MPKTKQTAGETAKQPDKDDPAKPSQKTQDLNLPARGPVPKLAQPKTVDAVEVAKLKEELGTQGTRLREMEKGLRAIHDMAQNMAAKSADILAGGMKKVSEASKPAFKAPEPSNANFGNMKEVFDPRDLDEWDEVMQLQRADVIQEREIMVRRFRRDCFGRGFDIRGWLVDVIIGYMEMEIERQDEEDEEE